MRSLAGVVLMVVGCNPGGGAANDTGAMTSGMVTSADLSVATRGVVACEDPSRRDAVRFDRRVSPSPRNSQIWVWANGIIAADLDEDGNLDLVTPSESTARIYWGSPAGSFREDVLEFDLSWGIGGSAVDYDGDQDLDLYITRYGEPNVLLRNEGGGRFVDVTEEAGVACWIPDGQGGRKGGMSMAASWADYDRDGDLDLFVGNYGWVDHSLDSASLFGPAEPSCLFVNNGDGTLTDVTDAQLPYATFHTLHDGYTYVAAWQDLNDDGFPELYSVNDFGTAFPNTLLWNQGGTLALDHNAHGLDLPMTGMGLAINDLSGDGAPDMVVPIWNNIRLMQSYTPQSGDPIWTEVQGANGIRVDSGRNQKVGWGAEAQDLDNDADLDVVVAFGFVDDLGNPVWNNPFGQPDALYVNEGGVHTDQAAAWGTDDRGVGRGFAVVDLNRDGWLDIAKRDLNGPNVFYVSHCGEQAWLSLELRQPGTGNTRGIGAKVTVFDGDRTQVRWVHAGGTSHATGLPPEVHFGLGDLEGTLDRVEIQWPDGAVGTLEGVTPRQHLVVTRTTP